MENVRTRQSEYSRRLPPPEAWKRPDKWIDLSTGLVKSDASKLVLPTDNRGFLRPDEVVEVVEDMFFWKDYDWPFEPTDPETAPDDHHFYYTAAEYSPEANGGSLVPSKFRELPTVIGRMPRQFHNTIHDLTVKPEMPSREEMGQYAKSYMLAQQAFKSLIETAKKTTTASRMFAERDHAVRNGIVEPRDPTDQVAKEFMRDFFAKHFEAYSQSVDRFRNMPERLLVFSSELEISKEKPSILARKMGKYVIRSSINYTPVLQAA